MKPIKTIEVFGIIIATIFISIVVPAIILSLISGHGAFGYLKVVGLFFLWGFGLCTLPIIFWEKAKEDENFGVLGISIVLGEGFALYKYLDALHSGILELIGNSLLYTFVAWIVLFIVFSVVQAAIDEGEKEFYKSKCEYYTLKEKNLNELTPEDLKYLEYNEKKFQCEFKPKRI